MKILFNLFLFFPLFSLAGGVVGNGGGDLVLCETSAHNSLVGYYNLDYLVASLYDDTASEGFSKVVRPTDSFDQNFLRILNVTKYKFPKFHKSLDDFYNSLLKNDLSLPYRWKKAPFGLPAINDEQLKVLLPPNCAKSTNPLLQAVIRDSSKAQVEFFYDSELIKQIENRPLQKSFLFFHEWLRAFTDDPEVIRNANAILHSPNWSLPEAEARMRDLIRAGLDQGPIDYIFENLIEINVFDDRMEMSENGTPLLASGTNFRYTPSLLNHHFVVRNYTSHQVVFRGLNNQDVGERNSSFIVEADALVDQPIYGNRSFCVFVNTEKTIGTPDCQVGNPRYLILKK